MYSQYVEIPDSVYSPGQLLIWFRPGILNEAYLGCDEELSRTSGFPLTEDFIKDPSILGALENLNVNEIYKLVPNLNPCSDTISIARRGDTIRVPDFWNILLLEFDDDDLDMDIPNLAVYLTLLHQDAIKIAEPNFYIRFTDGPDPIRKTAWVPNDTIPKTLSTSSLGDWDPIGGKYGTEVYKAWDRTKGDPDIRVGIIDDGVCGQGPGMMHGHPDFGSYGDAVAGGYNYFPSNPKPYTYFARHGTKVASIIGALSNNDQCIPGIVGGSGSGDNVKLIALKIGDLLTTATMGAAIPAIIEGATANSASPIPGAWACDFLNMSFETKAIVQDELFRCAVAYAYANGVLCAGAMGNSYSQHDPLHPSYPADIDNDWMLAVGGSTGERKETQSEYGGYMDILAPFSNYALDADYNAYTGEPTAYYCSVQPNNTAFLGTSSATPHAVGICALIKSYWKQQKARGASLPPYLAPEDYVGLLAEGVSKCDSTITLPQYGLPRPKSAEYGYGILNAENALAFLDAPYTLEQLDIARGDFTLPAPVPGKAYFAFPGDRQNAQDTLLNYRQYHVVQTNIPYGNTYTYNGVIRVWGRGGRTTGFPDIRKWVNPQSGITENLPLYRNATWCNVTQFDARTFDAETYLYEVLNPVTGNWEWLDGNSPGNLQFAITLLADGTQTAVEPVSVAEFEILAPYPNPVISDVSPTIEFPVRATNNLDLYVEVVDALGRVVYREHIDSRESEVQIPVSTLRNGIYYARFMGRSTARIVPFVVVR